MNEEDYCEVKMERGIMYLRCSFCGCEAAPFDMHDAHDAAVEMMKRFVLEEHSHEEAPPAKEQRP